MRHPFLPSLLLVFVLAPAGPARAGTFTVLGPLPGLVAPPLPGTLSEGGRLSEDGAVVAGNGTVGSAVRFERSPFRFQEGRLEDLAGRLTTFAVPVVAGDGSRLLIGDGRRWWVWEGDDLAEHAVPPEVGFLENISGSSRDGTVFVGQISVPGLGPRAYRHADGAFSILADPDGVHVLFGAVDVSADGAVVAGFTQANVPFLLDVPGQELRLLPLLPGATITAPSAMTPDARVVVGAAAVGAGTIEAFRSEDGMTLGLGVLPGSFPPWSVALDVSADGSVVVGSSSLPGTFLGEALVWEAAHGWRRLAELLEADGVDVGSWHLIAATGVSADGRVLVGTARSADGRDYAYRARLGPVPVRIDLLPGSPENPLRPGSPGSVPVTLVSSWELDAGAIDLASLECAGAGVVFGGAGPLASLRDVDGDGRPDLQVKIAGADLDPAALEGGVFTCRGTTDDGTAFEGSDGVRLVGRR